MKKIVVYCDERASEKRISAFLRTKGYQPAAAADMDAAAELCADAEGAVFVFFSEKPCEAVRRAAENAEIVAVVQAAELFVRDGVLVCDRNAEVSWPAPGDEA